MPSDSSRRARLGCQIARKMRRLSRLRPLRIPKRELTRSGAKTVSGEAILGPGSDNDAL